MSMPVSRIPITAFSPVDVCHACIALVSTPEIPLMPLINCPVLLSAH